MSGLRHPLGWSPWLCLIWLIIHTGCAGYRLGMQPDEALKDHSIKVTRIANQTKEPGLAEALSFALRQQIQRDGSFALETHDPGDIRLEATLLDWSRNKLTLNPQDILTIRDFEIVLRARVRAIKQSNQRVILDDIFLGSSISRAELDLAEAERRVIPLVAEDIARQVIDRLSSPSWEVSAQD